MFNKDTWEADFDKLVGLEMVGNAETYTKHTDPMAIKGFIRVILATQRQEVLEECAKLVEEELNKSCYCSGEWSCKVCDEFQAWNKMKSCITSLKQRP